MSDLDNPVKPLLDILQKKYWFNDRNILELHLFKTPVSKWNEFIEIHIETILF